MMPPECDLEVLDRVRAWHEQNRERGGDDLDSPVATARRLLLDLAMRLHAATKNARVHRVVERQLPDLPGVPPLALWLPRCGTRGGGWRSCTTDERYVTCATCRKIGEAE